MGERKAPVQREFGPLKSYLPEATPFLKWAGGKTQLLSQLDPFFPEDFITYFEPFLGGGAVSFHLRPERAILSDTNPELINVFQVVRDSPDRLTAALDRHYPHRNSKDYFYRVRKQNPVELSAIERAARTIFLNKTCYNGLWRVNARGEFNVPFGKYKNPSLYNAQNIAAASAALHGKIVTVGDYRDMCQYARRDDFVYLDPPYQPLSPTASFTGYTKESFSESDQKELAYVVKEVDGRGCKVMLSNSATDFVRSLYDGLRIERVRAKRAINSHPSGRGAIDELLILNY